MNGSTRPSISENDIERLVVENGVTRGRALALLSTYGPAAFNVSRAMNPMAESTEPPSVIASGPPRVHVPKPIPPRPVPPVARKPVGGTSAAPSLRHRGSNESIRYPLPGDYPREPRLADGMAPSYPTYQTPPQQADSAIQSPPPWSSTPVLPTTDSVPPLAPPQSDKPPDERSVSGTHANSPTARIIPSDRPMSSLGIAPVFPPAPSSGISTPSEGKISPPESNLTGPSTDETGSEATESSIPISPVKESPPWDYRLPQLPKLARFVPGGATGREPFSPRDFASAMQRGVLVGELEGYLSHYGEVQVAHALLDPCVQGFDLMFYAVATNKPAIVRLCILFGGNPNAVHAGTGTPLLGFAILQADTIQQHTTGVVSVLLALGASSRVFPSAFFSPFLQDLPLNGPHEKLLTDLDDPNKEWCRDIEVRKKLADTMDLSQRYFLAREARSKKPSARHLQVAKGFKIQSLLGIQYFLIGQPSATASLTTKLLAYMTLPSNRPLVLVFAGPSGHGKTELARKLGELLNLPLQVVDCTIYNKEADLFGYRPPHAKASDGTPANNFLVQNAGRGCIMFLDEFEKTTDDVHKSLLIPFDNGEYQDRRNSQTINCAKTIWILATNALDNTIMRFYDRNKTFFAASDEPGGQESKAIMTTLARELKQNFKERFKPPLTGRISGFIPFLPFSGGEQAVIAHKYILDLAERVRREIKLLFSSEGQLVGRVYLRIARDATICSTLAAEGYDKDLGARSLIVAVKQNLEEPLVEAYLEVDEEISEGQDMMEFLVNVVQGSVTINLIDSGRE